MRTSEKLILLQSAFSPYRLPNLAASYSLSGAASDNTYLLNAGNVQLIADQSINSRVNGLVLNGASGNNASAADIAATRPTGDLEIRHYVAAVSYISGSIQYLVANGDFSAVATVNYGVYIDATGHLTLIRPTGGTDRTFTSTVTLSSVAAAFSSIFTKVTFTQSNGGNSEARFYTSPDDVTYTQLGATVTIANTGAGNSNATGMRIGSSSSGSANLFSGSIFRARVYNGIAGTLAFDANFTTVAKLAASFTESSANAATVTINTSGDLGARISGARDHVQMTPAKQRAFSTVNGCNIGTDDGSNDYSATAAFVYSQPCVRYTVWKNIAWNSGNIIWAGRTTNTGKLSDVTGTPQVQLNAGSAGPTLTTFVLGQWAVAVETLNSASSALQRNLDADNVADAGAGNPTGDTLGADHAGANNANVAFAERLLFNGTHNASTKAAIVRFFMRKYAGLVTVP